MTNTTKPPDVEEESSADVQLRAAVETLVQVLRPARNPEPDTWLFLPDLEALGFTYTSLRGAAADGLAVKKGPKGKLMVRRSEVDRWIESRSWKPKKAKSRCPTPDSLDEWEREQEAERLRLVSGGAK